MKRNKIFIKSLYAILHLYPLTMRLHLSLLMGNSTSFNKLSKQKQYACSFTAVTLISFVCYLFSGFIGYREVAFILLLLVSIIAVLFDILPVLFTAALSAFIWDFFFIPPRFNLHVNTTEDAILLIMYFLIALINGVFTYKIRQAEKMVRIKEEKANSVHLYNTILNSLSHELRTPVAAIVGASDNLLTNWNLSEKNREQLISEISNASLRLNQQIENLLNISRLESGHIAPKKDWLDVAEIIYEVARRVEENGQRKLISISIPPGLPLCFTDGGMLDQIVYNLVNNAAIHTPAGSKIEITVACYADLLQITVEDNGTGFTIVEMKTLFQKFSRSSRSETAGSGLGLSIVNGFTDALNGKVEVEKSGLGGAKFILTLPLKTAEGNEE